MSFPGVQEARDLSIFLKKTPFTTLHDSDPMRLGAIKSIFLVVKVNY